MVRVRPNVRVRLGSVEQVESTAGKRARTKVTWPQTTPSRNSSQTLPLLPLLPLPLLKRTLIL